MTPGAPPTRIADGRLRDGLLVTALGLLIFYLLFLLLRELRAMLQPLFIAAFLCYLIVPLQRRLAEVGLRPLPAYCVIVAAIFGLLYGAWMLARPTIDDLSGELPAHLARLETFGTSLTERLRRLVELPYLDGHATSETQPTTAPTTREAQPATPAVPPAAPSTRLFSTPRVTELVRTALTNVVGFFASSLIVLFFTIFLLAEQVTLPRRIGAAFTPETTERIMAVVTTINTAVAHYLAVKTFISLLVAAISYAVLLLFGVKYAFFWAALTFAVNYVPYVGAIFAVALPVAMSIVQFDDAWRPATVLVLLFLAQQATGSYLEPRIAGRRLGVSPLMILLSLAFWGLVWGPVGMLLAVPLLVSLKIVLENIERTRPIARLIGSS